MKKSIGFRTDQRDTQSEKAQNLSQPEAYLLFARFLFIFQFPFRKVDSVWTKRKESVCRSTLQHRTIVSPPPTVWLSFCLSFCFACNPRQRRHTHRKGGFFLKNFETQTKRQQRSAAKCVVVNFFRGETYEDQRWNRRKIGDWSRNRLSPHSTKKIYIRENLFSHKPPKRRN